MNFDDLKEYIRILYEMELSVTQQTDLLKDLNSSLYRMNHSLGPKKIDFFWVVEMVMRCIICFSCVVAGFELARYIYLSLDGLTFLQIAAYPLAEILFFIIGYHAAPFIEIFDEISYRTSYISDMETYRNVISFANQLDAEIPPLQDKLVDTMFLLKSFYNEFNYVPSPYRNLNAISMVYSYLSTGRCSSLEGENGAYQIYEKEFPSSKERHQPPIKNMRKLNRINKELSIAILQSSKTDEALRGHIYRTGTVIAHTRKLTQQELGYKQILSRLTATYKHQNTPAG